MKKILFGVIVIFSTALFSSCLTSVHPLVTADKIIPEDRLVGNWLTDDDTIRIEKFASSQLYKSMMTAPLSRSKGNVTPQMAKDDSIMYSNGFCVSFTKDKVKYNMFAALTRIGNSLYFDMVPVVAEDPKHEGETGFEYMNYNLATFSIAKLEIANNNRLLLRFLNGDYIKELIKSGNVRIKYEKDELFETFVVTASSEELRQFLAKYGHDERLFSKENSITLTRKG